VQIGIVLSNRGRHTRKKNFTVFVGFSFLSMHKAKEHSLDKDQTSYDDLLDALRLSLNGYEIN